MPPTAAAGGKYWIVFNVRKHTRVVTRNSFSRWIQQHSLM
jgi:hypothetical protein